jgi:hypothetical protein
MVRLDVNSLKYLPFGLSPALALNRNIRCAGAGALGELRETIIGLLRERDQTMCAECVATALGQPVGVVMMTSVLKPSGAPSGWGQCPPSSLPG